MTSWDLPDIYAHALGPAALGLGHMYQTNPSWSWYNNYIFSIVDGERGEKNLVEFNIETGDSAPIKQAARHILFVAREEIAVQLSKM